MKFILNYMILPFLIFLSYNSFAQDCNFTMKWNGNEVFEGMILGAASNCENNFQITGTFITGTIT